MNRLDRLLQMLDASPADAFLLYGIAMEHKKAGQTEAAIDYLNRTLATDPTYCYAYYQKGQILEATNPAAAARVYAAGIEAAKAAGDGHAQSELQAALDEL